MGKKKKIREEFDAIFKTGDEAKIRKLLENNPWLLDEVSSVMDDVMLEQKQILGALGVMEDDLGTPVPVYEIERCLREDFNTSKTDEEIKRILEEILSLTLVSKEPNGWTLTGEGGRVCDEYLNKNLGEIDF